MELGTKRPLKEDEHADHSVTSRGGIARRAGIRAGEGRLVGWVATLFAVTQASHGLGATTADTLFLSRFGIEFLPVMILASGPAVMFATIFYMAGMRRLGAARWLAPTLLSLAGWVALERLAVAARMPGAYPLIWLGAQVAILVSYTVVWNAAGEVCTTRQAKRLFPIFASAGIAGAIAGNGVAGTLTAALGTENLLIIHAGLLAGAAAIMATRVRPFMKSFDTSLHSSIVSDLRAGFDLTRTNPLLRLLAWLAIALNVLFFLVVFRFNETVATSFGTEAELARFIGTFAAVATVATLATALFGAGRLFRQIGVVGTLLIVPAVYLFGFGLWSVSFGLVTATLVRGTQWVAVNALGGTALSSMFNVIPGKRRSQAATFNAAIPTQIGTTIAGALLVFDSSIPEPGLIFIGLGLSVGALALGVRMRHAYTDALVRAVHTGLEVFSAPTPGVQKPTLDADAHEALSAALSDPSPGRRAIAATLLGRLESDGREHWPQALADEDPRVRAAALHAISDRPESVEMARDLLADPVANVRRRAVQILEKHGDPISSSSESLVDPDPVVRASAAILTDPDTGGRILDSMLSSTDRAIVLAALEALAHRPTVIGDDVARFVTHPDRQVRAAAARCLIGRTDRIDTLLSLLDDPSIRVRNAAADTLAAHPDTVDALVELLSHGSVRACDAALQALAERGLGGDRCREWISGEVARARYLRLHRMVLLVGSPTETVGYLSRLLRSREHRLERWALMAITVAETENVIPVLKRAIWAEDPEVSAQALEALDSLASHSLVRPLIALLEDDSTPPNHDAEQTLRILANDTDDWIRALSIRSLIEGDYPHQDQLRTRWATDPSPLVRTVMSRSTNQMNETDTFDTVDRVLALQRASIFSEIDPEDLERIAVAAIERRYHPDETIYRYGEEGKELLVVVSGDVEVRRPNGQAIRTFGAGEHVGELALLGRRTRAADVIAGPAGVHVLALEAAEFEVILEERPTVAMAMLATLADRMGTM